MEITQIKETCLYVNDLIKIREFYETLLGFQVIGYVENRHLFFKVNKQVLLFFNPEATRSEQHLPPHYASGKQHIAFEVPADQYEGWKKKLIQNKVAILHEAQWKENLFSFYFEDPAGNILEILPPGIWK